MKEFAFSIDLSEKETPLTNCTNSSGKSYAHLWTTLVNYIRRERVVGSFTKSFALGDVDTDKIDAKFENGILNITIPKQEVVDNTKTIEIK